MQLLLQLGVPFHELLEAHLELQNLRLLPAEMAVLLLHLALHVGQLGLHRVLYVGVAVELLLQLLLLRLRLGQLEAHLREVRLELGVPALLLVDLLLQPLVLLLLLLHGLDELRLPRLKAVVLGLLKLLLHLGALLHQLHNLALHLRQLLLHNASIALGRNLFLQLHQLFLPYLLLKLVLLLGGLRGLLLLEHMMLQELNSSHQLLGLVRRRRLAPRRTGGRALGRGNGRRADAEVRERVSVVVSLLLGLLLQLLPLGLHRLGVLFGHLGDVEFVLDLFPLSVLSKKLLLGLEGLQFLRKFLHRCRALGFLSFRPLGEEVRLRLLHDVVHGGRMLLLHLLNLQM
mmetsp:Transcript_8803/g.16651  ORF Transcript_8803/g.16651 Transcript_8803/m.16651 type:complete len:344 (-) Transcript_8803:53-1084(-)